MGFTGISGCSGSASADCDSWVGKYTSAMQSVQGAINKTDEYLAGYNNGSISFEDYLEVYEEEEARGRQLSRVTEQAFGAGCESSILSNRLVTSRPIGKP